MKNISQISLYYVLCRRGDVANRKGVYHGFGLEYIIGLISYEIYLLILLHNLKRLITEADSSDKH